METGLLVYYNSVLGILVLLFILFVVLTIKFFKKNLGIVSLLLSIILFVGVYQVFVYNLSYYSTFAFQKKEYTKALNYSELGAKLAINRYQKAYFYGEAAKIASTIPVNDLKTAGKYYEKAYQYAGSYKLVPMKKVWSLPVYIFLLGGDAGQVGPSDWPIFANEYYILVANYEKAEMIMLNIAEKPNYLTLIRISVLNDDMSKALNYVNELIKVKPESTSYAIRANIHKNIGQIELYESDKNRAINLCRNNAKCVKAAQIFAEVYVEGTILKEKKRRNMYGLE